MRKLSELEEKIKILFSDKKTLRLAFIHRSFLNESGEKENNERLEFLGDAVLEIIVSDYIFRNISEKEGILTSIRSAVVKMESLAEIARELSLGDFLYMAKGEDQTGGRNREYILANTFEALLGAIYIDKGIDTCREFLLPLLNTRIDSVYKGKSFIDSKTKLQELSQSKFKQAPQYFIVSETGPDHDKTFTSKVEINSKIYGKGEGKTKQSAEENAAKEALKELNK